MKNKKYFLRLKWGYRTMTFEFETIQEATDFADTYFNAKVHDIDDEDISVEIGMYYDKPEVNETKAEEKTEETEETEE